MRIHWGISVAVASGLAGVACSSFGGDAGAPSSPDGGTADDASTIVTGAAGDNSLVLVPPTGRQFVIQGQTQSLVFNVKRGLNVSGPVAFAFDNLPGGVAATSTTLAENDTRLNVQLTADAAADQKLSQVKVTATARADDGTPISLTAQLEVFLRGPAGAIDTTFGTGGKVAVDSTGSDSSPTLIVGPKDEIYTVPGALSACTGGGTGAVNCVFRYTADGAVDTAFGPGGSGQATSTPTTYAGVVQPDGRFVGVGSGVSHRSMVFRLNPDGTPDSTFGNAAEGPGTLSLGASSSQYAAGSVALAVDGSFAVTYGGAASGLVGIERLNAKGATIASFGDLGLVGWSPDVTLVHVPSILVKKNGHVVMAAVCGQTGGAHYEAQELDPLGSVVSTFGASGKLSSAYRNYDDIQTFSGTIAYADGSLVFPISKRIVRINAAGQFDPTFGTAGAGYVDLDGNAYGVAGLQDGKIVVYTKPDGTGVAPSVVRLNANGDFDKTFGTTGNVPLDATLNQAGRAAVQSDGRILVMSAQTITRVWN